MNTVISNCNININWEEDTCKLEKVIIIHIFYSVMVVLKAWYCLKEFKFIENLRVLFTFTFQLVSSMVDNYNCVTPWLLHFTRFLSFGWYCFSQWARAERGFNGLNQEVWHHQGGLGNCLDHHPMFRQITDLFLRKSFFYFGWPHIFLSP